MSPPIDFRIRRRTLLQGGAAVAAFGAASNGNSAQAQSQSQDAAPAGSETTTVSLTDIPLSPLAPSLVRIAD